MLELSIGAMWFFGIGILGVLFYASWRIFKLYKYPPKPWLAKEVYFSNGVMLIVHAALLVGATGLLESGLETYNKSHYSEVNSFRIGLRVVLQGLKYLAPLALAAIGVNLASTALTHKA